MVNAMSAIEQEITAIRDQIINLFQPEQIYLFGSWAKGSAHKHSDIDLCIIVDTADKRELVREILLKVEYERDLDVVVYTPQEWEKYHQDSTTFAYTIYSKGVKISG